MHRVSPRVGDVSLWGADGSRLYRHRPNLLFDTAGLLPGQRCQECWGAMFFFPPKTMRVILGKTRSCFSSWMAYIWNDGNMHKFCKINKLKISQDWKEENSCIPVPWCLVIIATKVSDPEMIKFWRSCKVWVDRFEWEGIQFNWLAFAALTRRHPMGSPFWFWVSCYVDRPCDDNLLRIPPR